MAFANFCSLIICSLLVLFIVAMVRIKLDLSESARGTRSAKRRIHQISQLPNLVSKPSATAPRKVHQDLLTFYGSVRPLRRRVLCPGISRACAQRGA